MIWPLMSFLMLLALVSTTGHAADEGTGGERAKEVPRAVEPKKKPETEARLEPDPKPASEDKSEKAKSDEPPSLKQEEPAKKRAAEPKKKDPDSKPDANGKSASEDKPDKTKAEEPKAKAEELKPKPEEPKAKIEEPKTKPEEPKAKIEEPAPPKAEEPTKKPVTSLNLAIKLALMADPHLFPLEIEVEIDKGKAVLSGAVPTEEEKNKAAEIAGKLEGVEGVVNKLQVTPALRDKLAKKQDETIAHVVRDRLSRSETLKAVGFDVKSENGVVYLSGKTRFQVIALEAAEAARQVPGVRAVDTAGVQLVAKE
jgi:osmotically-inducible protein OsmY